MRTHMQTPFAPHSNIVIRCQLGPLKSLVLNEFHIVTILNGKGKRKVARVIVLATISRQNLNYLVVVGVGGGAFL